MIPCPEGEGSHGEAVQGNRNLEPETVLSPFVLDLAAKRTGNAALYEHATKAAGFR